MTAMLARTWKTVEGKRVDNPVETIPAALAGLKVVHIGTDSQQHGMVTEFVTVIVVLDPGRGGRAFYTSERVPRIKSLRERLLKEVWMSVSTALEVNEFIGDASKLQVHVDVNPDTEFKSSQYIQELVGMVVSQGFVALTKPDAWAAMHVADHVVKHKVIGRQ